MRGVATAATALAKAKVVRNFIVMLFYVGEVNGQKVDLEEQLPSQKA